MTYDNPYDSLININPEIIRVAAVNLNAFAASPIKKIPIKKAPTAPIPVQIIYAVPKGILFIEIDKSIKLATIVRIVRIEGTIFVKPKDCFIK